MYSQENATNSVVFSIVAGLRAYSFTKKGLHIKFFCEICEVLQNLIFTKDSCMVAHCCQSKQIKITKTKKENKKKEKLRK